MPLPNVNTGDPHVAAHNTERAEINRVAVIADKLPTFRQIGSGVSLNTITKQGQYVRADSAGSTVDQGYPFEGWAGYIEVVTDDGAFLMQRATYFSDPPGDASKVHVRTKFGSNWSAWLPMAELADARLALAYNGTGIFDLDDAPLGIALAYNDALNRPPGFSHCLIETHEVPFGRFQRATNMFVDGTGIAVRGFFNGDWSSWRVYNEYQVTRDIIDQSRVSKDTAMRAGAHLAGGGDLYYTHAGVFWTQRFIIISDGKGDHFTTDGFFDIAMPPAGTVVAAVGGGTPRTVENGGLLLDAWTALYYILPIGSASTSKPENFRLVNYQANFEVPANWVLIAKRVDDGQYIQWANGAKMPILTMYDPMRDDRQGTGSPVGSQAAELGTKFIDRNATAGAIEWIKTTHGFDGNGWEVVYGDTNWRNIVNVLPNGWTAGSFAIRREGKTTTVVATGVNGALATSNALLDMSQLYGFHPKVGHRLKIYNNVSGGWVPVYVDPGFLYVDGPWGSETNYSLTLTWAADAVPWPVVLPGIPT